VANLVQVLYDKDTGRKFLGQENSGGGPLPAGFRQTAGFHFVQTVASNHWHIVHNGHTNRLAYAGVFDTTNVQFMPDRVEVTDANTVDIYFASPVLGTANLVLIL
jgi:hypothetical protein